MPVDVKFFYKSNHHKPKQLRNLQAGRGLNGGRPAVPDSSPAAQAQMEQPRTGLNRRQRINGTCFALAKTAAQRHVENDVVGSDAQGSTPALARRPCGRDPGGSGSQAQWNSPRANRPFAGSKACLLAFRRARLVKPSRLMSLLLFPRIFRSEPPRFAHPATGYSRYIATPVGKCMEDR